MTAVHEPGDVWHIGWDWHADMWYVEPPFDVDLDEPIKWFNERHQAFDFVDDWIREQPVSVSVVDQVDSPAARLDRNPETKARVEAAHARIEEAVPVYVPEPPRQVSGPVYVPQIQEARTPQEIRLAEYAARVGLK